jgi:hypothetical protein
MKTKVIELWVLVDEDGDAVVSLDDGELSELYEIGARGDASVARRCVKVLLTVPLPEMKTVKMTACVVDDEDLVTAEQGK